MKYYVISDIHGFYTPMIKALIDAGYFEDKAPHKLVVLGDLLDRGQEAVMVQDFILDQMANNSVILIRGNHEDMYDALVTTDEGLPYNYHLSNGTYSTAMQLTGFDRGLARIRHYDFADEGKNTPFYSKIMPAMLDYYETEHYVFVHGWIPCLKERNTYAAIRDWRNSDKDAWDAARWVNGIDAAQTTDEDKTIVCGHWHASYGHSKYERKGSEFGPDADFKPYYGPHVIAIDGCTAHSGIINCVVLDEPDHSDD